MIKGVPRLKGKECVLSLSMLHGIYGNIEIVVFNGLNPALEVVMQVVSMECTMWSVAGLMG